MTTNKPQVFRNIAIIGGGISGLAAAYYLKELGHRFTIFESAHHFGGNARTIKVNVGGETRWMDLGVNDFSRTAYTTLVDVFARLGVEYAPIGDTTAYNSYQSDIGVSEPFFSGYTMEECNKDAPGPPEAVRKGKVEFAEAVKRWMKDASGDPDLLYLSALAFVKKYGINETYTTINLFPRISGMIFGGDIRPGDVPIRAVIHYYTMQEGSASSLQTNPERMYWLDGTRNWIYKLTEHLMKDMPPDTIRTRTRAKFRHLPDGRIAVATQRAGADGWREEPEPFDKVILGVQAKDLPKVFAEAVPDYIEQIHRTVSYTNDVVVPHTWTGMMPTNINAWSTYNIRIWPEFNTRTNYQINYSINQHQNDAANPKYNCNNDRFRKGLRNAQYLMSFNPPEGQIPEGCILARPAEKSCTMFRFYHIIMTPDVLKMQDTLIPRVQGRGNIYLVGGYTAGTGLHEECWLGAREVVKKIEDDGHQMAHLYDPNAIGLQRFPDYLLKPLGLK